MLPIPTQIGQIRCTIVRDKSGWNKFYPKYLLKLSETGQNLLQGKKRAHNATSNYQVSLETANRAKPVKDNNVLGKVRANFLGTEFYIFDEGCNPNKAKSPDQIRAQQGVVQYETNLLGSKGPRRMKVLLPNVDANQRQFVWKSSDSNYTIQEQFKQNNTENIMFFFNKPPKWNECKCLKYPNSFFVAVQAFVLNFNGRVDKASVKNFQLIDEYDDNKIYMQFGRIG